MSAIISYAGPPRWKLPELIERQREAHRTAMREAWVARLFGRHAEHEKFMRWAALARLQLRQLKACQHALDTRWAEKTWERVR